MSLVQTIVAKFGQDLIIHNYMVLLMMNQTK